MTAFDQIYTKLFPNSGALKLKVTMQAYVDVVITCKTCISSANEFTRLALPPPQGEVLP